MRTTWSVCATAAEAVLRRTAGRCGPWWVALLLTGTALWLLTAGAAGLGGAALGMLAGGWGLGLVPVHSNRLLTGPQRRTAAPPQPPDPADPSAPAASGAAGT
ncbi:hypothetical protein OG871_25175 [Kitasatospora sp. NBC_00374]|uniref:hypothetical protein n=1 Tax=Kitasatospora sp. NBC_00374 TaxID=2975964 RepID=UPI0032506414